ncbi:MAG: methionine ABC transporter permease [Anaerovoracaceae bacterium]
MSAKEIFDLMLVNTWETLYMTFGSTGAAYVLGLPLGIMLTVTEKDGIKPMQGLNSVLGSVINILRSVPFLILMIAVVPITRAIMGTSLGSPATIVPLTIAAFPFVARMVESSIKEVDKGVVEAALSMGAGTFQIITKVLIPEAKTSLILGATISTTTILGYSAMAGAIGGGGLGKVAINYGLYRFEPLLMWIAVIILVVLVQLGQFAGNTIARKTDKR